MTAEKPEGDVSRLAQALCGDLPYDAKEYEEAADLLVSQAVRIQELKAALRTVTDHFVDVMNGPLIAGKGVHFANGAEGIPTIASARRALSAGQGEAK